MGIREEGKLIRLYFRFKTVEFTQFTMPYYKHHISGRYVMAGFHHPTDAGLHQFQFQGAKHLLDLDGAYATMLTTKEDYNRDKAFFLHQCMKRYRKMLLELGWRVSR